MLELDTADHEGEIFSRAYSLILSWPKPENQTAPSDLLAGTRDEAVDEEVCDETQSI